MRTALILLVLVGGLFGAGCNSSCNSSCDPQPDCCPSWKPNCCNSWDFYVPCNTLCGTDGGHEKGPCEQVPTCTPQKCPCR
jgi:hypothetical protein